MQAEIMATTAGMSREEWRELRRRGIGGSDAAAVVGMSRYATPFSLWASKTGRMSEPEENERMRLGKVLEPYVADRFSEKTSKKVRRLNAILTNESYPFALANIDRRVVGEAAGLECKTTNILNLKQFRDGEFPDEYYVQCVHYLAVTGWDRWYLAVLVLGSPDEPRIFTIERNQAEIDMLMDAERSFWANHITADIPPPVDGTDTTTVALADVYPGGKEDPIEINQPHAIEGYLDLGVQIKALKAQREKLAQIIKADMGDHERASCGDYSMSWASQTRIGFDHKTFALDHQGIDLSKYFKVTTSRTFRVKGDTEP